MPAEPIELPSWWGMYREDQAASEARVVARFEALIADIERRVTIESFEAEKRFQNERARLTEQKIESDRQAMLAAIELETAQRAAALAKEADDRSTAIQAEQKAREDLESSLGRAEAERKSQRRWTVGLMGTIGAGLLTAIAGVVVAILPHWTGG